MENRVEIQNAVNAFVYGKKFTRLTGRGGMKPLFLYIDPRDPRFLQKISGTKLSKSRLTIRALTVSEIVSVKSTKVPTNIV